MRKFATIFTLIVALTASVALADGTYQTLPFAQDWSNAAMITVDDDWAGVPGIIGYRGDNLVATTGVDPQTILLDDIAPVLDVNADELDPNTFITGGVAEFAITDPAVALNGSGTADAPYIQLHLATTGWASVNVAFNLRDLDGSADNSVQPIAVHYRVGTTGDWTNLPAGFVADASSGPDQATLVTAVAFVLPSDCDDQAQLQLRIMTANAIGNDEWIGIDDIAVTSQSVATESATWGSVKALFN